MVGRVCIIGAGPSGLSVLCWFAKKLKEGKVRKTCGCWRKVRIRGGGLYTFAYFIFVDPRDNKMEEERKVRKSA